MSTFAAFMATPVDKREVTTYNAGHHLTAIRQASGIRRNSDLAGAWKSIESGDTDGYVAGVERFRSGNTDQAVIAACDNAIAFVSGHSVVAVAHTGRTRTPRVKTSPFALAGVWTPGMPMGASNRH